jgi:site-specific recombinase XerD
MDQDDLQGFEKYLSIERRLGERTVAVYLIFYKLFDPTKLSQEYVNEFILQHHNTTIIRAFVKHYLDYQGITGIFKMPMRAIGRKPQKIVRSITENEFKIVRDYFYNSSFKHGLLFDMIHQGAMRRVEIITITLGSFFWNEWLDNPVDFCKLIILGKGKKQRIVLINPETAESILDHYIKAYNLFTIDLIKDFISKNKDALLFASPDGHSMKEKQIYDVIKKLSVKALGRDIRPHELRHSRASELQKRGIPIGDIRNYLGHTKLTTTEIYLHKSGEESLNEIKEKLAQ